MLYGWNENLMLTNCLAACAPLTITVSEIERDICRKSSFFHTPLHSTPPYRGVPVGVALPRFVWKNWNGYLTVKKISNISLFVLAQLTIVTDRQTDGQTPHAGNSCAMHSIARQLRNVLNTNFFLLHTKF